MRTKKARKPDRQTLTGRLREVIAERGLTAYALGRDAEVDVRTVQRWLAGDKDIRLDTADRIAEVLGLRLVEAGSRRGKPKADEASNPIHRSQRDGSRSSDDAT